jgi:hypothetical protein
MKEAVDQRVKIVYQGKVGHPPTYCAWYVEVSG